MGLEKNKGLCRELGRDEYRDLRDRVGKRLTQGMPDWILDEFGLFMDGNVKGMHGWLLVHRPDYRDDPNYLDLIETGADEETALRTYGALAWLDVNCPGYVDVVNEERQRILAERELTDQVFWQSSRAQIDQSRLYGG